MISWASVNTFSPRIVAESTLLKFFNKTKFVIGMVESVAQSLSELSFKISKLLWREEDLCMLTEFVPIFHGKSQVVL
jgi:hypothetical protein